MLYLISLIPFFMLVMIIWSITKLNRRIDALEERITTGYAPILSDLHRRLEVLEQEE